MLLIKNPLLFTLGDFLRLLFDIILVTTNKTKMSNKNEIKEILKLMESNEYFEYKVKSDNFLNDNYKFLEDNDLVLTYSFGQISDVYVVREKHQGNFMMNHMFSEGSIDLIMNEQSNEEKTVKHQSAKILKFKR